LMTVQVTMLHLPHRDCAADHADNTVVFEASDTTTRKGRRVNSLLGLGHCARW
jgi:hypothetical protein